MNFISFTKVNIAAVVCAATLLSAPACDKVKAPPGAPQDLLPADHYPAVVLERGIHQHLVVDYANVSVRDSSSSSPLSVSVPIRSTADVQMRVQYEFRWYDETGRELDTSGLKFAVVEPRRQIQMQGNSLTSKAKRWRLEVRAAR